MVSNHPPPELIDAARRPSPNAGSPFAGSAAAASRRGFVAEGLELLPTPFVTSGKTPPSPSPAGRAAVLRGLARRGRVADRTGTGRRTCTTTLPCYPDKRTLTAAEIADEICDGFPGRGGRRLPRRPHPWTSASTSTPTSRPLVCWRSQRRAWPATVNLLPAFVWRPRPSWPTSNWPEQSQRAS